MRLSNINISCRDDLTMVRRRNFEIIAGYLQSSCLFNSNLNARVDFLKDKKLHETNLASNVSGNLIFCTTVNVEYIV